MNQHIPDPINQENTKNPSLQQIIDLKKSQKIINLTENKQIIKNKQDKQQFAIVICTSKKQIDQKNILILFDQIAPLKQLKLTLPELQTMEMIKSPDSNNRMLSDYQLTQRLRQQQDWIHPASIYIQDQGPNISDRYSDASSPNGRSFITTGQPQNKKQEKALSMMNAESIQKAPAQRFDMSDVGSQEITSSLASKNGQRESKFGSGSYNFPKKKSKHSLLSNSIMKREELIYKTKKLIKEYLKQDVVLEGKGKTLQLIFKKLHSFIKVVRVFARSHSISAEQHRLIRDLSSHRHDKTQFKKIKLISWFNIKNAFWSVLDFVTTFGGLNKVAFQNKVILLPTDTINVYWMAFQFFFNFFALYYASIYIVFDFRNRLLEIDKGTSQASSIYTTNVYILIFTTIADVFKGFNTGFYRKGDTIIDRKEVAINYLKGRFIFDFVSLFSVIMSKTFFPKMDLLLMYRLQFLFLFKIHNIQHVISVFKSTFIMNEKYDNIISLFRLLCILCLTSHAMAICYHGQAQLQIYFLNSTETWLDQANIVNEGYWVRYINSFFCSAGTLVNAIIYNPKTTIETVFMTLCLLVNCCIFGYVINELGNIMDNIERNSKTSKKELRLINSYLQKKNVNRELQTRIRNYLEYMHREEKQLNLEETKVVITKLSNQLKSELTKEVNTQYIEKFHILNTIFSKKIQEKSLFIMQDHKYTPGEVIFREGQEDDYSIYLIWEGQIDIYHTNQRDEDYLIQTLTSGHCFGEISFFTGQCRTASARSSEFTSLIKIERQEFIHLIKEHSQEDYEIFQQLNHKIQQSQDYSLLYQKDTKQGKCYTCGSTSHIAKNCNLTHFQPLPVAVIQTASRSFYQDRTHLDRKIHKKWHGREHNNLLNMEAAIQKVEEENESRIEELNENLLDMSDYEMDQSENQGQGQMYYDRGFLDRQNTGGQHYMLSSNQDHNDTVGIMRGDFKNMSINIPNNPYLQQQQQFIESQRKDTIHIDTSHPFKDSKDIKDRDNNNRKIDSFNNLNVVSNQKNEQMRRGSKFQAYNNNTLTQIQEIASPVLQPVTSGNAGGLQSNPSTYYQQQPYNTNPLVIGGLQANSHNNSFQNMMHSPLQTNMSPKNLTNYGMRKNKKQPTHLSSTQAGKRGIKYESQNTPQENTLPRSNTQQVGQNQMPQIAENNNNQPNKMRDSNINLVEQFGNTISLHIDYMRNFKKYFPNFNISAIERTSIGKKSQFGSTESMKKNLGGHQAKKSATIKRAITQKNKGKNGVYGHRHSIKNEIQRRQVEAQANIIQIK